MTYLFFNLFRLFFARFFGAFAVLLLLNTGRARAQTTLFEFSTPFTDSASSWNVYTDQTMGGNSLAEITISDSSTARFSGTVSFGNEGGIAQIISPFVSDSIGNYEGVAIRFRGDGTTYILCLQDLEMPCSAKHFEYKLFTEPNKWTELQIPFSQFKNTYFGTMTLSKPLNLKKAKHIALINAYQEGVFWLDIDWLRLF